jgi:hypothetical protein
VHPDLFKPTLNAPGTKRLKLKHDEVLSSFAVNCNLRRYVTATAIYATPDIDEDAKLPTLAGPCRLTLG